MDILITGRHIEITDAIRTHATEKVGKLGRYNDRLSKVEAVVSKPDARDYEVELIAHIDGADHLVATASHTDVYHGFEAAVNKMERQLTDHKEKHMGH
ncbi:MAG: ribosome hibernation-promoting factor, HPF/YfiA family [Phycisphaerales bacterium JB063]